MNKMYHKIQWHVCVQLCFSLIINHPVTHMNEAIDKILTIIVKHRIERL